VHYDATADGQRFVIRANAAGLGAQALRMHIEWTARE
jgi:hypothetical protein